MQQRNKEAKQYFIHLDPRKRREEVEKVELEECFKDPGLIDFANTRLLSATRRKGSARMGPKPVPISMQAFDDKSADSFSKYNGSGLNVPNDFGIEINVTDFENLPLSRNRSRRGSATGSRSLQASRETISTDKPSVKSELSVIYESRPVPQIPIEEPVALNIDDLIQWDHLKVSIPRKHWRKDWRNVTEEGLRDTLSKIEESKRRSMIRERIQEDKPINHGYAAIVEEQEDSADQAESVILSENEELKTSTTMLDEDCDEMKTEEDELQSQSWEAERETEGAENEA
jgi:hypothetical protein